MIYNIVVFAGAYQLTKLLFDLVDLVERRKNA